MADNIAITPGSGVSVAADDVSSVFFQKIKVDLGGDGATSPLVRGQQADAASIPVTLSTEQAAFLDGIEGLLTTIDGDTGNLSSILTALQRFSLAVEYETVAASQTNQTLGATGAAGDYLSALLVIPATTAAGQVQIKDGSGTAITVFTGGTGSVTSLVPFTIALGLVSTSGAWQVTTGANVSAIGIGNFT